MKNLYLLKALQHPDQSDYTLQVFLVSNVSLLKSYELKDLKIMLLRKYNKTPPWENGINISRRCDYCNQCSLPKFPNLVI